MQRSGTGKKLVQGGVPARGDTEEEGIHVDGLGSRGKRAS